MKYSIYIRGRNWAFQLAKALNKKDKLKFLITSYPKFYANKYGVPDEKIHSVVILEVLIRILRKISYILRKINIKFQHHILIEWLADFIFSKFYLNDADVYIVGFGNSSSKIIKEAKKKNIKTIYFLNTSSPGFRKKLEKEFEEFGLLHLYNKEDEVITKNINESIQNADYVGSISTFQKKTYIDDGILKPDKVLQLNSIGVDTSIFYPKSSYKSKFIVIAVGNDFIRKGFKYLVEGFNSLNLYNSELWIVGNHDKKIISKLVQFKKNNLIFFVNEFDLPKYYNQSSIFCLPTLEEGAPAVISQAMSCGLPIIVSKNCQGPDVIDGERNGFIVEARNSKIIAEKIKFFYDNPEKTSEMGKAASIYAKNNLSMDVMAYKINEYFEKK